MSKKRVFSLTSPMRSFFLVVFLMACMFGFMLINGADAYRDRATITARTELSVNTTNGDAVDYANLAAMREADKNSVLLFDLARVGLAVVSVGGAFLIAFPRKEEKETE